MNFFLTLQSSYLATNFIMPRTAILKSDLKKKKDNLAKTRSFSVMAANLHSTEALALVRGPQMYPK